MTARLHEWVAAACPIVGVSVGRWADRDTWAIQPTAAATAEQVAAGTAALATFDVSPAAQTAWEEDQHPERKAIRAAAAQALAGNAAYLALSAPTAAQVRQQTDALTRQVSAVIRRLVQID